MVESEAIAHFCAVTDAPASTAEHYLSISNGDLDTAVTLFFEGGGAAAEIRRAPLTGDDGAAAPVTIVSSSSGEDTDEPFVPVVERGGVIGAMDVSSSSGSGSGSGSRFSRLRSWFTAPMEPSESSPFGVSSGTATATAQPSEHGRRLADLFRPPFAILDPGNSFATARSHARSRARYLVFSLHDPTDFASQAANRDWWNDAQVQRFVHDRLVFVQANVGGAEAQRYCSFYPLDEGSLEEEEEENAKEKEKENGLWFPHVAVIDPRTGERVLVLSQYASIPVSDRQVIDASGLVALLAAFISDHPLPAVEEKEKEKEKQKQSYVDAAEKRIRLEDSIGDGDISDIGNNAYRDAASVPNAPYAANAPCATNAPYAANAPCTANGQLPEEPEASAPNTTLIQLRLPDGRRLRRRFLLTDTTAHLYHIVRLLLLPANAAALALITHEGPIPDSETTTLQSANLGNALVTVAI